MAEVTQGSRFHSRIDRALKPKFESIINDLQVSEDLLASYFPPDESYNSNVYRDIVGEIGTTDIVFPTRGTPATAAQRRPATPQLESPNFDRRMSAIAGVTLNPIPINRFDSFQTGMSRGSLKEVMMTPAQAALMRAKTRLTLKLLVADYYENPILGDAYESTPGTSDANLNVTAGGRVVPFPRSNQLLAKPKLIPAGSPNAGKYTAPLEIENFLKLSEILDSNAFMNSYGQGGMRTTPGQSMDMSDKLLILDTQGVFAFQRANLGILSNKDFWGTAIQTKKGYGKIRNLMGLDIVELPTGMIDIIAAIDSSSTGVVTNNVVWAKPSSLNQLWNGAATIDVSGDVGDDLYVQQNGLLQGFLVNRIAFELMKPDQTNINFYVEEDPDFQREQYIFANLILQGMRYFESLVQKIYFTDIDQILTGEGL